MLTTRPARRRVLAPLVIVLALALAACSGAGGHVAADPAGTDDPGPVAQNLAASVAPTDGAGPAPAPVAPAAPPGPVVVGALAPVVTRVPTEDRVVFLTIDDGYTRDPAVLDWIAARWIPVTTFLVQEPAQVGRAFWQQAQAGGATVEAHTIDHRDLTRLDPPAVLHQVCDTLDPYQRLFGRRPTLFRPPYGATDDVVRWAAASCGYRAVVNWSGTIDGGRLHLLRSHLSPGDILLAHWKPDLLPGIEALVARARAEGFTIAPLERYL